MVLTLSKCVHLPKYIYTAGYLHASMGSIQKHAKKVLWGNMELVVLGVRLRCIQIAEVQCAVSKFVFGDHLRSREGELEHVLYITGQSATVWCTVKVKKCQVTLLTVK